MALADIGDAEGFDKDGEENQLYAFQLSDWVYKRTKVTRGSLKFEELSDVDTSHAVPKRLHTLVFTGEKWFPFADPVQQKEWLVDIQIVSPYVMTGNRHRVQKIVNSGTRLCSNFPKTKNIVITETSNSRRGILKMVSEIFPLGIIGLGSLTSTILLEIVLGDRPDNFVEVLPGFKLKWGQAHANKELGVHVIVREMSQVRFTLEGVQHQADHRTLEINEVFIGPVDFKRLRFTPNELTSDQTTVIIGQ